MSITSTQLKDIVVGNIVYVDIAIDQADMADPNSVSTTAKKIKKGENITRPCVVLEKTSTSLIVTYLATFAESSTLPTSFADKSIWYPVEPATKESTYDPLPEINGKARTSPQDAFALGMSSKAIRPPSPHIGPQPNNFAQAGPPSNLAELAVRITALRPVLEQADREFEAASQVWANVLGTPAEGEALQKVEENQIRYHHPREIFGKLMAIYNAHVGAHQFAATPQTYAQQAPGAVGANGAAASTPGGMPDPAPMRGPPYNSTAGIPPLDKLRFEPLFKGFCHKRSVNIDPRSIMIDNRPIDLHALHREIFNEGGWQIVDQKDLWAVLGARIGFTQYPGTDTEPATSGPDVARHLQHIYKAFVLPFDAWYASQYAERRSNAQQAAVHMMQQQHSQQQQQQRISAEAALANNVVNGGPTPSMALPPDLLVLVPSSRFSADELRARGQDEQTIQLVERYRSMLQRVGAEERRSKAVGALGPQWACLRKKQIITTDPVEKASISMTEASARSILAAMKA